MRKVREEKVFLTDLSKRLFKQIDFADTFANTNREYTLEQISKQIFDKSPKWVNGLFKLRNSLVRGLGLKTSLPKDYNTRFEVGGYIKFFKIVHLHEDEIVLGVNDSHLDFRAVINKTDEPEFNVKVTTLVKFNNKMGRIYMCLIAPFHRMVIKRMIGKAWQPVIQNP